jgi:hypothetical protein
MDAINSLFSNLLNMGTQVGVTVCAVFLMWGAYMYASAAGNPHRMERGTSAMWCAVVGLIIVVSARVIAGMIRSAVGA